VIKAIPAIPKDYKIWLLHRSKSLQIIKILKTPTIHLITLEFPPKRGGAGVYCNELSYIAAKLGFKLKLWVPKNSHSVERCEIYQLSFKGSQSWLCSLRLILNLRKRVDEHDILHLAEPAALLAFIRFGWLIKGDPKIMITIHGSELLRFGRNPLSRKLFSRSLSKAFKIHVLSKHNEEKLLQLFPYIQSDCIIRLPGGVPRGLAKANESNLPVQNRAQTTILCVGRIHPRKGQFELLEAIKDLPPETKQKIVCKFVGPFTHKSYSKQVEDFAHLVGCQVEFLGDLSDEELSTHYTVADIFALTPILSPKSVEGFGFVYLEASYFGLPVIGHRVGGVEDAVDDGQTGLLADPEKRSSLTKILQKLISDESLRSTLGSNGKKWALAQSWEKLAIVLYERIQID